MGGAQQRPNFTAFLPAISSETLKAEDVDLRCGSIGALTCRWMISRTGWTHRGWVVEWGRAASPGVARQNGKFPELGGAGRVW